MNPHCYWLAVLCQTVILRQKKNERKKRQKDRTANSHKKKTLWKPSGPTMSPCHQAGASPYRHWVSHESCPECWNHTVVLRKINLPYNLYTHTHHHKHYKLITTKVTWHRSKVFLSTWRTNNSNTEKKLIPYQPIKAKIFFILYHYLFFTQMFLSRAFSSTTAQNLGLSIFHRSIMKLTPWLETQIYKPLYRLPHSSVQHNHNIPSFTKFL